MTDFASFLKWFLFSRVVFNKMRMRSHNQILSPTASTKACIVGWSQISQVDRSHMLACAHVWHDHRMPPSLFPGSYVQPPKVTEASSVCSYYLVMYPHIEAFEEASVTLGGCTH